jgi:hypothetical protein
MSWQQVPNRDLKYALLSYDADGKERGSSNRFSAEVLAAAQQQQQQDEPLHVFLFVHGWRGDIPAAIDQYNRWFGALWNQASSRNKPLCVGLHWPSEPWGDESLGGGAASFGIADAGALTSFSLEKAIQCSDGEANSTISGPLEVIFNTYAEHPSSFVAPPKVVQAYQDLAAAIGFQAGTGGASSAPDLEGAALDPQAAIQAMRIAESGVAFGRAGKGIKSGILGGLSQLSFWMMKKRARAVGEGGMHGFVASLMNRVPAARIHLMGHSFGCVVVSSILGGPGGNSPLPRPVDSAVLVQGALSLWSWAAKVKDRDEPGYFHRVLSGNAVRGPVVTTRSRHDKAVGLAYPAAVALVGQAAFDTATTNFPLYGGTGAFGLQGTGVAVSQSMLDVEGDYGFQAGRLYNLEASPFIPSHSGIDSPQVAHVLWQAAAATAEQA